MMILAQSTSVDVGIGPFLDETDGFTAETGLTITQPDIRLKKNNGNWAQKNAAQTLTHEENGWYEVTLDATDTNTLGTLIVAIHESGALPVWKEYMVVPTAVYNALVNATGNGLRADVQVIAANAITASAIATDAITAAKIAADAITAAKVAADVSAEIADAVWDEVTTGHVAAGTYGELLDPIRRNTAQAGDATHITLDASASATNDIYNGCLILVRPLGGNGFPEARVISDYDGSTKIATITDAWTNNPGSGDVFIIVSGALPSAAGGGPSAATIADAVWDELRADHTTAGTFGQGAASVQGNVTGSVASVTGAVGSVTGNVGGNVVGSVASVTNIVTANVTQISGDSAAADNAEAFFDGTGYAGTNNVIPTVTTVTNQVTANVAQISGDTTAADNAEAFFDGTGYAGTNNTIPTVGTVSGAVTVGTNNDKSGYVLSSAGVDAILDDAVDGSTTARESFRLWNAALGGKASGLGTSTANYRDLADTKNRITATVDADGNRTAVARDLS